MSRRKRTCELCGTAKPALVRPRTGQKVCKACFYDAFEQEIHETIVAHELFQPGDRVLIGASGGKDSTVLAYVLKLLNERHEYGLHLELLSIDEGIAGYRDDSLETVKLNSSEYELDLTIISYEELYGWTMDRVADETGGKQNCSYCGVFRRQALDRGALSIPGASVIATGHCADDLAEAVLMNIMRGDAARLGRCVRLKTSGAGELVPRCKPLGLAMEKEIVMYAYFRNLTYFSTECRLSANAFRGWPRELICRLLQIRPSCVTDIIASAQTFHVGGDVKVPKLTTCSRCGYVASQPLCKACKLLDKLNKGKPKRPLELEQ